MFLALGCPRFEGESTLPPPLPRSGLRHTCPGPEGAVPGRVHGDHPRPHQGAALGALRGREPLAVYGRTTSMLNNE